MVQPAKDIVGGDAATALNWAVEWGVFAEAEMSAGRVVIAQIGAKDALKM